MPLSARKSPSWPGARVETVLAHPYKGSTIRPQALQAATRGPIERKFMPWNNQSGGGGGPWGRRPVVGGARVRAVAVGSTPNLEEILSRGRDRFQGVIPGGTLGHYRPRRACRAGVLGVQGDLYGRPAGSGRRAPFGKPKPELTEPGLHFHWWPIENVERVNVTENQTDIGGGTRDPGNTGLMLSGDQNIVDVQFSVLWSVSDPDRLSVQRPRSRRHGAQRRRKRDARSRRPPSGAGHLPRRPRRHCRGGAPDHQAHPRQLRHRRA